MRLLASFLKALRPTPAKAAPPKLGPLFAPPYAPPAGWWRDDPAEQLRNYRSWVYAAVNAIAQEAARHRPLLFTNTGQAEHEQSPLPHTHPLCRLLEAPNPWLTPWELWYLTIVYLELTGNGRIISYTALIWLTTLIAGGLGAMMRIFECRQPTPTCGSPLRNKQPAIASAAKSKGARPG